MREHSFLDFAQLLDALEATTKRNKKKTLISSFLQRLGEKEVSSTINFLLGRAFPETDPRILEIGGRTIFRIVKDIKQKTLAPSELTILKVHEYFNEIAKTKGKGSRKKKEDLIKGLFNQATLLERKYLIRILVGEMRIGVAEGLTLEAIAEAASVELNLVRRANMLSGNLGETANIALKRGEEGLKKVSIALFTPIKPMLAEMSNNLEEVIIQHKGATSLEYKLDGARVQIHIKKGQVEIFSRQLTKVTESLPEIIEVTKKQIEAEEAVLEGEVIAYGDDEKPLPFQTLMKRFRRTYQVKEMTKEVALRLYLFDVLYLNGRMMIDKPYIERRQTLTTICEPNLLVEQVTTDNLSEAETFLLSAIKHGHEGLIAKELNSIYVPGKRGKKWFKIKTTEYLDLVITAADWGYGRRTGWLSNYHLAAWDEGAGEYLRVGKTFKGLNDDEFREMTRNLLKIKIKENRSTVFVKPKIVVEVAFNEIQGSTHYKSGFALRFARITRIRKDKNPENADTTDRIKKMYDNQFKFKARFQPK